MTDKINKRVSPFDTRVLNDATNITEAMGIHHENNARKAAAELAEKYKDSPVYLELLSRHIRSVAEKAYAKHQREQEAKQSERSSSGTSYRPKRRDSDNGRFMSEDNYYEQD